jgi:serine/threonine protein kinase/tetratricopeptide (TPR) repeat protein
MVSASTGVSSSERETVDYAGVRLTRTRPLGPRTIPSDDPKRIDRYTVQRRLGVGGMSVVYEALDERIGRRVAIKLMQVGDVDSDRERLRREAQALARVSHPNVVEVFEIGEHDGKPYVAMALVEGEPLDRWLRSQVRAPTEIVEAFVQAGEGLAAAHAHGLVHRDFKPGNVLMGVDGRVRVVDFGLVRESGAVEPSSSAQAPSPAEISARTPVGAWTESLTRTGAMVGTPAYMSPEQLAGLAAGPASDQFSFCVALYEALYDQHPFVIDCNWQQLPYNVLEGRLHRPPKERRVPAVLGKAIMRGLALRPEARWPGMDALLHALRRALDRRGPGWPTLLVGVGLLVVGIGGLYRSSQSREEHHCRRAALVMQRTWSPGTRDDLRDAWLATGLPGAADTWTRVDARLQVEVEDWWGLHRSACSGTVPASSSATCLLRWADELHAHLEVMEEPSESVLHNAVQMVGELPALERCSDALDDPPDAPASEPPPWEGALHRVDALVSAGKLDEATPLLEQLVAQAGSDRGARLTAEANLRIGKVLTLRGEIDGAAAAYEEAYLGAKPLGLDRLAAKSALGLLQLFGEIRHRPEEAARWANHARAETERVDDPALTSAYLNYWGRALRADQKLEEALVQHQRALELQRSLPSSEPSELALSHFQIGSVLGLLDRVDEARPHLEESLRILEEAYGPRHPRVATTLTNLGIFLSFEGRYDQALAKLELARQIGLEAYPGNPWPAAFPLRTSAMIHMVEGRTKLATEQLRTFQEAYIQTHTPEDTNSALLEFVSCQIATHEGDHERALEHCRRALQHEEGLGTLEVDAPNVHQTIGAILAKQGKLEEAFESERAAYQASLRSQQKKAAGDAAHAMRRRWYQIDANQGLGRALAMVGRYEEALALLEQARSGYDDGFAGSAAWRRQGIELDMGTTLLALGRHEEARVVLRAMVTATEARAGAGALDLQRGLVALARAELAAGNVDAARELAERALELLTARVEPVPDAEAGARFVLARCLYASPSERSRALALARRAEEAWAAKGPMVQRDLDEVRRWLAEHGRAPRRPT